MIAEWLGWVEGYFTRYGYGFVVAALFLENVCFLGIFVPGAVVLTLCGMLARQAGYPPYPLALFGLLGTLGGDAFSYGIGRKLGARMLSSRYGAQLESVAERVRKEPILLATCHFVAYLRMFVPMAAGLSRVPFLRWLPLDATGATLWVSSMVLLGYVFPVKLADRYAAQIGFGVGAALLGLVAWRLLRARKKR